MSGSLWKIIRLFRGASNENLTGKVQALIAGLGNPGDKYRANRHNVGFMVVDLFSKGCESGSFRKKFQGQLLKTRVADHEIVLLKPLTYMNLSGGSVREAIHFYNLPLSQLIVVHDELDLEFGVARIKVGGGAAGHKGLKSIVEQCGGSDFIRLRMGIGRPKSGNTERYVLSDFNEQERERLPEVLENATAALMHILTEGAQSAMNRFHAPASSERPV